MKKQELQTQEALALLQILTLTGKKLKHKKYKPLRETFRDIRKEINAFKKFQKKSNITELDAV